MAKFTFLEIHLDGADISANAPFSGSSGEETGVDVPVGDADEEADEASEGGGPSPKPFVALLLFVVLAIALKRLLGASDIDEQLSE